MKAKLNIQHDYVTLRIEPGTGQRLNLTTSYGGIKATAKGEIDHTAFKNIFNQFNRIEKNLVGTGRKYANVGDFMAAMRDLAEKSVNYADFSVALTVLQD